MTKLTNYTAGPKGVNTKTGQVFIGAGETAEDLDLSDAEMKVIKGSGWFDKPGADDEAPFIEAAPSSGPAPADQANAKPSPDGGKAPKA